MKQDKLRDKWLPQEERVEDETIIFFLRRHPFVLVIRYFFILLFASIPLIVFLLLQSLSATLFESNTVYAISVLIISIYYLILWVIAFTVFLDYYLDIWIVTSYRIIDMELKGLFNYTRSEQALEQVQDVSASIKGIFPTFLNYGDVLIQSAGARNLFHFRQIPEPETVSRTINQLAEQIRNEMDEN